MSIWTQRIVRLCRVRSKVTKDRGREYLFAKIRAGESITEQEAGWLNSPLSWIAGRFFIDCADSANINWYRNEYDSGGEVVVVEMDADEAEKYRVSNLPEGPLDETGANPRAYSRRPTEEFFLPRSIGLTAKPLDGLRKRR